MAAVPLGIRVRKRKDETIYKVEIELFDQFTGEAIDSRTVAFNDNLEKKAITDLESEIKKKKDFMSKLASLSEGYHDQKALTTAGIEVPPNLFQGGGAP